MKKVTIREWVIITIALLAVSSATWGYYHPKTIEVPGSTEYRDVTKTKYVTVKVPVKTLPNGWESILSRASGTTQGKEQSSVTESECVIVALDEKIDGFPVTAKAKCPAGKVSYDVASIIVPETGETRIFIKPEKRSIFSFENDKEIGLRYGLMPEVDLFGRWTFIRIGEMYGSVYGEVSSGVDANANVMIEVSYRW